VADAAWRCSQCGTVYEPVANACRTCGRWPSLFELEGATIESEPQESAPPEMYEPETIETEYAEPELYDVGRPVDVHVDIDVDLEDEEATTPKPLWQRLASFIVPIGIVLYILVSALANRDSG
jgi:hypothetical protein